MKGGYPHLQRIMHQRPQIPLRDGIRPHCATNVVRTYEANDPPSILRNMRVVYLVHSTPSRPLLLRIKPGGI
jgi:hypothetical protein